ncbi:hypothetical protein [Roseinatronobacter alkalisoli]|uniref:Uncharacterized protein n=1 Tax=Roseinatronobacter alkalisoli TaxID=3028235 RepID=A0ABT5T713_9RHOB|nr:hypothetical protein [Roseinatronobacter sp. HJB301]MDD7970915.1 hypothetical protein [Roseinatronobacter sp. HJB301]
MLQLAGTVLIILFVGGWWLLDRFGCSFNTAGCSSILPTLSLGAVAALIVPVGLGIAMILAGRRIR